MKSLNAFVVTAKPSGTLMPLLVRWPIISPKEAFFPPTLAMSLRPISFSHSTCSLARPFEVLGSFGIIGPA